MHLLSILLLAASANVDNLAVAIAYGIKRLRIGILTNLFIATISAIGTYLSISVGQELASYVSLEAANLLGSMVLVGVGLYGIRETIKRERRRARNQSRTQQRQHVLATLGAEGANLCTEKLGDTPEEFIEAFSYEGFLERPEKADRDRSGNIDIRESIALAFGLTLNNLGVGIGAGVSDLNVFLTTLLTFGLSVAAVIVGYRLGRRSLTRMSGLAAGLISGLLIVITGIYEYFVI